MAGLDDQSTEKSVNPGDQAPPRPGPFLAKVVGVLDQEYMGGLTVQLMKPGGNDAVDGQTIPVKMLTPFYGTTGVGNVGADPNDYNNTQKSYGMWFVPPDVGTIVLVFFIDGNPKYGYWMGCALDDSMNFMLPGIAATEAVVEGGGRLPVAEYNKKLNEQTCVDTTKVKKPKHPFASVLEIQGLVKDDVRGITTSSARRDIPSAVFGISTPGPLDKTPGSKTGDVGVKDNVQKGVPVSRLGGTTFVMDDGDDKFLRKTKASDGPPEYTAVEQGETGGDVKIPHNELVRIRTRTGHQILLHNSEDLIYIGNARGTTWIELTSNGKIDIYAEDSISLHTKQDFNVTADRDINMTAKGNINLNSTALTNLSSTGNFNINSAGTANITSTGAANVSSGAGVLVTGTRIDLNGPAAAKSIKAPKAVRIPQAEPWKGHENLDPTAFTPAKTKAVVPAVGVTPKDPVEPTPASFGKYSTATDTFSKIKGAE